MGQIPLAQLQRYDSQVIERYYRFRPWQVLGRAFKILSYFTWFLVGFRWEKWRRCQAKQDCLLQTQWYSATRLRQTLTVLGPTFIKVGQALSTRPDLVRKDFLEELVKLQDQLPPFPTEVAFAILERELDREIGEVFSYISPRARGCR
ncbi:hypothetical protein [Neosynechococcus sphagnicola]|uniref:hypothetical protein n=1 Tax=Neosynechococcus sphagnicola TaxID=1501145 RepID=UPI000A6545EE